MYNCTTGLGQRIPADVESGMQILNGMILHWDERARKINSAALVSRVRQCAAFWAQANELANFEGRFDAARAAIGRGIGCAQQIAPAVMKAESIATHAGPFSPAINQEVTRLERGSSVMEQVKQTLGAPASGLTEVVASSVEAISPATAEALRGSSWIVPGVIAAGAILLLRR